MKKVLILQNKGKTYGGVWQVNKLVGEELIKYGYDVSIVSIRNNQEDIIVEHDPKLNVFTINEEDIWSTYKGTEILEEIKKIHIFKATKMLISRIKHEISINNDVKKLHKYIEEYKPNYILTSHYQLLDMIPKEYLNVTINEQHSSFKDAISHKATRNTFNKYNGKIKFLWLTKKTMEDANNYGLVNNIYIYNAVRFKSNKVANVIKNKKLITIARISEQKRIDIMVDIAKEVFKNKNFKDWVLEIYGDGELEEEIKKQIGNHKQIKLMGVTDKPKEKLLTSSINLNTSSFEGFSLSILEANECGVPTITFDFGESVFEEIINGETGIIADDKKDYVNKLKELMSDTKKLKTLATNCKEFNNNFQIEIIVNDWIKLFNEIDKK